MVNKARSRLARKRGKANIRVGGTNPIIPINLERRRVVLLSKKALHRQNKKVRLTTNSTYTLSAQRNNKEIIYQVQIKLCSRRPII